VSCHAYPWLSQTIDAVSGGATIGRGSHTLGFGGAGSVMGLSLIALGGGLLIVRRRGAHPVAG